MAIIEEVGKDEKIAVHFLEYDEYLANNEKSQKKEKVICWKETYQLI